MHALILNALILKCHSFKDDNIIFYSYFILTNFRYTGAIAAVTNISNPISLARMVMEKTDHCLLVGEGANMFAKECNMPNVDPSTLITEACLEEWHTFEKYKSAVDSLFNNQ